MKILKTSDALESGQFLTEHHCKPWQKFSVLDEKSGLILITADTRNECEKYVLYLKGIYVIPEFYKSKVNSFWRKNKWKSQQIPNTQS
jgi:hypothetical protein